MYLMFLKNLFSYKMFYNIQRCKKYESFEVSNFKRKTKNKKSPDQILPTSLFLFDFLKALPSQSTPYPQHLSTEKASLM